MRRLSGVERLVAAHYDNSRVEITQQVSYPDSTLESAVPNWDFSFKGVVSEVARTFDGSWYFDIVDGDTTYHLLVSGWSRGDYPYTRVIV